MKVNLTLKPLGARVIGSAPYLLRWAQPALTTFDVLNVDRVAVMEEKPEGRSEELKLTEEKSQDGGTGDPMTHLQQLKVAFY